MRNMFNHDLKSSVDDGDLVLNVGELLSLVNKALAGVIDFIDEAFDKKAVAGESDGDHEARRIEGLF